MKLPEVQDMRKNLNPNILPEKQHTKPITGKKNLGRKAMNKLRKSRNEKKTCNHSNYYSTIKAVTDNSRSSKNKNKENKQCIFHISCTFCKQCQWGDDTEKTLNKRCSLPSRSSLQALTQTYQIPCRRKS